MFIILIMKDSKVKSIPKKDMLVKRKRNNFEEKNLKRKKKRLDKETVSTEIATSAQTQLMKTPTAN